MKVQMWGIRGSAAVFSSDNRAFGANTACVEVTSDNDDILILDAGSGIISLGKKLQAETTGVKKVSILLSHSHWDHIQGFTNFDLLYDSSWHVDIYAPKNIGGVGLSAVLGNMFNLSHFPVPLEVVCKQLSVIEFTPGDTLRIGDFVVESIEMNHPGGCVGYKVCDKSWGLFYSGDHEHTSDYDTILKDFLRNIDVIIADGTYTAEDYKNHVGWGHSAMDEWIQIAEATGTKHLVYTHFCLEYNDKKLHSLIEFFRMRYADKDFMITFAKQGLELLSPSTTLNEKATTVSEWITDFSRQLSRYYNVSTILDTILSEARFVCNAEGGTIYLAEGDMLSFEYSQNDVLFTKDSDNKHLYINMKMPIDNTSIAGYAANNSETLNIRDVYELDSSLPYSFNQSFDQVSNYRTQSVLTIPFIGSDLRVIGVLQLINPRKDSRVVPFNDEMVDKIQMLCMIASNSVQKGQMSNDLVMRMLQMSSLKDPKETGAHVKRVGAVSAELYLRWARKNNISHDEIKSYQDNLRLAAMLHDVGKVGIPDAIIKKPGQLTPEERAFMQKHCAMGGALFISTNSEVDKMSKAIAQNHHQKWDGTGYTGSEHVPVLKGKDIPLAARITSVADVYDALVSKRSYKEAWDDSKAVDVLRNDSGTHFDPEIVECFIEILPTIKAIYSKYNEE